MIGQILPNNNESATGIFFKKIPDLNTAKKKYKKFVWLFCSQAMPNSTPRFFDAAFFYRGRKRGRTPRFFDGGRKRGRSGKFLLQTIPIY
jgi:hypothetical protein